MMRFKIWIAIVLFLLFFMHTILAKEAKIEIENTGFGESRKHAYFSIFNTGDVVITDVTLFVDGKEFQKINGITMPGNGFETMLYLMPGEHFIEARTTEGAYDFLNVTISSTQEKPKITPKEEAKSFIGENTMWIALGLIVVILVIVWLLRRKPKL